MENNKSTLTNILKLQEDNNNYYIVKLKESLENRGWDSCGIGKTSGIEHYIRFGIAPRNGIYSISKLNEFVEQFEKLIGVNENNLSVSLADFRIKPNKKLFSKGVFCRAERAIKETLDIKSHTHHKSNYSLFLEVNDDYLIKNNEQKLMELFDVEKTSEEHKYFKSSVKDSEYDSTKENQDRSIHLRFFPDTKMLETTQNSIHKTDLHHRTSFSYDELRQLIGKENCKKLYS
jgi:hypothetical protein